MNLYRIFHWLCPNWSSMKLPPIAVPRAVLSVELTTILSHFRWYKQHTFMRLASNSNASKGTLSIGLSDVFETSFLSSIISVLFAYVLTFSALITYLFFVLLYFVLDKRVVNFLYSTVFWVVTPAYVFRCEAVEWQERARFRCGLAKRWAKGRKEDLRLESRDWLLTSPHG